MTAGQSQLQQVSLRDQALAVIRRGMITGEIVPGEIYSANSLAVKLGVSNSPVRDAMLSLVNQGLMETVRNRGVSAGAAVGSRPRKHLRSAAHARGPIDGQARRVRAC